MTMIITETTTEDWVDFWENEDTVEHTVPISQLAKLRDELKEQIAVAFWIWDLGEFEEDAVCGMIDEAFDEVINND